MPSPKQKKRTTCTTDKCAKFSWRTWTSTQEKSNSNKWWKRPRLSLRQSRLSGEVIPSSHAAMVSLRSRARPLLKRFVRVSRITWLMITHWSFLSRRRQSLNMRVRKRKRRFWRRELMQRPRSPNLTWTKLRARSCSSRIWLGSALLMKSAKCSNLMVH